MQAPVRSSILCVDDDADACEILSLLMSSSGIDATCVPSAEEAWPLIKRQHFDLYVLDGWLPGIDGFEFCRQIRQFDSHTPILFYSGAAYDADKQKGIAAGANAYVTKPDVDGLIETIADLVSEATARDVVVPFVGNQRHQPVKNSLGAQFFSVAAVGD